VLGKATHRSWANESWMAVEYANVYIHIGNPKESSGLNFSFRITASNKH